MASCLGGEAEHRVLFRPFRRCIAQASDPNAPRQSPVYGGDYQRG